MKISNSKKYFFFKTGQFINIVLSKTSLIVNKHNEKVNTYYSKLSQRISGFKIVQACIVGTVGMVKGRQLCRLTHH